MDRKWIDIAIGTVAFGLIFNFLWTDRRVKDTQQIVADDTEGLNVLYPAGNVSTVGCHMGQPMYSYSPVELLGGRAAATTTTGMWAA